MNRIGFIGGSDICPLLGISKWKTPYQLYLEKIGESRPISKSQEDFFTLRKLAEPYILSVFGEKTGIKPTAINQRYVDKEHDFMSVEIDFEYMLNDQVINGEIKTLSHHNPFTDWGDEFTNDVPMDYLCQSMFGLSVAPDRQHCHYAAMCGFDDFRQYIVDPDAEMIGIIREKVMEFWQRIQDRNPPPPQSTADYKLRNPNGKSIAGDKDIFEKVTRFKEIKKLTKSGGEMESLQEDIEMFIGDYDTLVSASGVIATWKQQESNRFDTDRFKSEHPDLYKLYLKTSKTRVLRIK